MVATQPNLHNDIKLHIIVIGAHAGHTLQNNAILAIPVVNTGEKSEIHTTKFAIAPLNP
jgi:hypothetical protein